MIQWLRKFWNKNKVPPGEAIFLDVPNTKYPNKYSEGLFFYTDQNGNSSSDLEYHTERGGDPEVFWAAINSGRLKLQKDGSGN